MVDRLDKKLFFEQEEHVPLWKVYRNATNVHFHTKQYIPQFNGILNKIKANLESQPPTSINTIFDNGNNNDFYSYPSIICTIPLMHSSMVKELCREVYDIFASEPNVLQLKSPITVEYIHGQIGELLAIFAHGGLPPDTTYLFLGDYVSRGRHSVEVITLLFSLKLQYPDHIFLLRGMHEIASINRIYGFYDEIKRKYNIILWKKVCAAFNFLPVAAIIDNSIYASHSGLGPGESQKLSSIKSFARYENPSECELLINLLSSTPQDNPGFQESDRGSGYLFGPDVTTRFLESNDLSLFVRSFDVETEGYQWSHNRKVLTIFSAADYGGGFENLGAILKIEPSIKLTIVQFGATHIFRE